MHKQNMVQILMSAPSDPHMRNHMESQFVAWEYRKAENEGDNVKNHIRRN